MGVSLHLTVDKCWIIDDFSSCTKVLISVEKKVYVKFFRFLSIYFLCIALERLSIYPVLAL